MGAYQIIKLTDRPEWKEDLARWFHEKWGIPEEAYLDSMADCLACGGPVPQWYAAVEDGRFVGGMGVIENDFHNRPDLTPNVCAVYTEPDCRGRGIAGELLNFVCADQARQSNETLYLLTDHTGFYERYGWAYLCPVLGDGEESPARMYIHRTETV